MTRHSKALKVKMNINEVMKYFFKTKEMFLRIFFVNECTNLS